MVVWGAAGCFVAEMLLCKSFWVFRGAWKGCVVFLCCLTAAMCAMEFDIIGFGGRWPTVAEVQSAHLSGVESAPYDDLLRHPHPGHPRGAGSLTGCTSPL